MVMHKYTYAWITLGFFLVSFGLHWMFGWFSFVDEAREHGQRPELNAYLIQMGRDTFENWQSEFLQLLWQVVGLAYFLYVGSPASKENDDRVECKIDELMKLAGAEDRLKAIDETHFRHHGHAKPHGHTGEPG
jgi:hypothetical protein